MFGPSSVVRNIHTGRIIKFIETPSSGLRWTPTNEPAYSYKLLFEDDKLPNNEWATATYVSPAKDIEDGRFVLLTTKELSEVLLVATPKR